jgi:hypothetical protein
MHGGKNNGNYRYAYPPSITARLCIFKPNGNIKHAINAAMRKGVRISLTKHKKQTNCKKNHCLQQQKLYFFDDSVAVSSLPAFIV